MRTEKWKTKILNNPELELLYIYWLATMLSRNISVLFKKYCTQTSTKWVITLVLFRLKYLFPSHKFFFYFLRTFCCYSRHVSWFWFQIYFFLFWIFFGYFSCMTNCVINKMFPKKYMDVYQWLRGVGLVPVFSYSVCKWKWPQILIVKGNAKILTKLKILFDYGNRITFFFFWVLILIL